MHDIDDVFSKIKVELSKISPRRWTGANGNTLKVTLVLTIVGSRKWDRKVENTLLIISIYTAGSSSWLSPENEDLPLLYQKRVPKGKAG